MVNILIFTVIVLIINIEDRTMKKTVNARRGHLNKLFTFILTVALMGFFIIPAGIVYATDSDNGAEPGGGGEPIEAESEDAEPPAVIVIDPPNRVEIEDEQVPQAAPEPEEVVVIPPERPPLAVFATWALLNLLLVVATGVIMIALLVTFFAKRKEGNGETENKRLALRLIAIAATAVSIILFVITQNMILPMGFIDKWTIWHVIITAATVVLVALSMKKYEQEKEISQKA